MINAVADLVRTYYYDARTQKMYDNMNIIPGVVIEVNTGIVDESILSPDDDDDDGDGYIIANDDDDNEMI